MNLNKKNEIGKLISSLIEATPNLNTISNQKIILPEIKNLLKDIIVFLKNEKTPPIISIKILEQILEIISGVFINKEKINHLEKKLLQVKIELLREIKPKIKILFLPYKASMWDSLESIYHTSLADIDCETHVVPIPYYEIENNKIVATKYEGDLFSRSISVMDYKKYNIEKEKPDIIYVHNIYDQYNKLIQLPEEYFTHNLKRHCNLLIFSPYFLMGNTKNPDNIRLFTYGLPSIKNVDKFILHGSFAQKQAEIDKIDSSKYLTLGSPKIDYVVNNCKSKKEIPEQWKDILAGKFVYFLDFGCCYWQEPIYEKIICLTNILNIPKYIDNTAIIWRPHPLTETFIKKNCPHFLNFYQFLLKNRIGKKHHNFRNIIIDRNTDYITSMSIADVLISKYGSLANLFMLTKKPVVLLAGPKGFYNNSLIDNAPYYFTNDPEKPLHNLAKDFSKGIDPLKSQRESYIKNIYENCDGTSGEKIHFTIKKTLLQNIS